MCSMVTRKAMLTLDNGHMHMVTLTFPSLSMLKFPKETEARLVGEWNKSQPNATHKVVSIHILRN